MRYYCSYMNNANLHLCPAQESYEFTTIIDRGGCVAFMAPVCLVSCLPGVLSASCPVCFVSFGFVSCLPGVLSAWCPVCLVSCLPRVLRLRVCRPRVLSAPCPVGPCPVGLLFCQLYCVLSVCVLSVSYPVAGGRPNVLLT